eukprot:scaffold68043_cov32-Tisochrysis_lutea.AAC.2
MAAHAQAGRHRMMHEHAYITTRIAVRAPWVALDKGAPRECYTKSRRPPHKRASTVTAWPQRVRHSGGLTGQVH